jgi:hypothetical protein
MELDVMVFSVMSVVPRNPTSSIGLVNAFKHEERTSSGSAASRVWYEVIKTPNRIVAMVLMGATWDDFSGHTRFEADNCFH